MPLELDQIYSSLDDLTVALGPNGANKKGALTDLLDTTAANFGGQGAQFHQTIENFGRLSETLADNKDELFGSAAELEGFITPWPATTRPCGSFNQSLASVSTMLAGRARGPARPRCTTSAIAMRQVSGFVKDNRDVLGQNITGLDQVTKVLVKQRAALDETLRTRRWR